MRTPVLLDLYDRIAGLFWKALWVVVVVEWAAFLTWAFVFGGAFEDMP